MEPAMMCRLRECPSRSKATILFLEGGGSFRRRCIDMGLVPGAELTVQVNFGGRMQVRSEGTSFALGSGMAEKIIVMRE